MSYPRQPWAVLLVVALGATHLAWSQSGTESAGAGDGPGGAREVDFSASLSSGAGRARSVDLSEEGDSSGSARVGFSLTWTVRSPRTDLYANLNPYYNAVFRDSSFSTYGISAGLGYRHKTKPRRTWKVQGRLAAAPDQDIPAPRISDDIQDPGVRFLVPRNGFVYLALSGGFDQGMSERSTLVFTGRLDSRRYDVYSVESPDEEAVSSLVDQRTAGVGVDWRYQSSERNSWGVGTAVAVYGLGDDPADPSASEDSRLQVDINGTFRRQLSQRSNLSVRSGFSAIDTGPNESESVPTLKVGWDWRGKNLSSRLSVDRNQGIFPGSSTSVDRTLLAGNLQWQGRRQSVAVLGGYGVSRQAGEDRQAEDTRSRNFSAVYARSARTWGWFVSAFNYRQNSDTSFGTDLVSSGMTAGFNWLLTGRRL